jgi:TonB family protein
MQSPSKLSHSFSEVLVVRRSTFMVISIAASLVLSASLGTAAEPPAAEPMALDFGRACALTATEEELSAPGVTKPRLTPKHPPKPPPYPEEEKQRKEGALVLMLLLVNEEGYVTQAKVKKSSGSTALDRASLEGTREWRFEPGRVNGKATCMWMTFVSYWK